MALLPRILERERKGMRSLEAKRNFAGALWKKTPKRSLELQALNFKNLRVLKYKSAKTQYENSQPFQKFSFNL